MAIKLQPAPTASVGVPQSPGVYFFKSSNGKILYIGKATNLRSRLSSRALPKDAKSIIWEILNSETEALIREAELIKKYRPKYNVLMRDDKQYFFVGFTNEPYPKLFITHQPLRITNKNELRIRNSKKFVISRKYVGPFTEGGALRSVLKILRRVFPYCTCWKPHPRLCLNARIGRCLGFCCLIKQKFDQAARGVLRENLAQSRHGGTSRAIPHQRDMRVLEQNLSAPEKYAKNIRSIKQILSGKNRLLLRQLKKEMYKLSDAQKYEEAGEVRNQIRALEKIFEHRGVIKQDINTETAKALRALGSLLKINEINRIEAYDIAHIHGKFAYGSMAVLENGQIKKDAYRLFKIKSIRGPNDPAMISEVLERRFKHPEWAYPEVIIVDGGKAQLGAARAALNFQFLISNFQKKIKIMALTKNKRHIGDHIFIAGKRDPISLSNLPEPLKNLILVLDSEAHRFAISHYRRRHRKAALPFRKVKF